MMLAAVAYATEMVVGRAAYNSRLCVTLSGTLHNNGHFEELFCCRTCRHNCLLNFAGREGDCRWCFWGVPNKSRSCCHLGEGIIVIMPKELLELVGPEVGWAGLL